MARTAAAAVGILLTASAHLPTASDAVMALGTPPKGWEDFDSHVNGQYNETFALNAAAVQAETLLPSGYDVFIMGGWSAGNLTIPRSGGVPDPHYPNRTTFLDEYGRPNPDAARFPSAAIDASPSACACIPRNCTLGRSSDCTDDVCICKAGSRSFRPLAEKLNAQGLRLGLWTWRGVHRMAAIHKLPVKGTSFTVDEIVDKGRDGKPCLGYPLSGRCPGECPWGIFLGINASHPGAQAYYDSLYELFTQDWKVEFVKTDCWCVPRISLKPFEYFLPAFPGVRSGLAQGLCT